MDAGGTVGCNRKIGEGGKLGSGAAGGGDNLEDAATDSDNAGEGDATGRKTEKREGWLAGGKTRPPIPPEWKGEGGGNTRTPEWRKTWVEAISREWVGDSSFWEGGKSTRVEGMTQGDKTTGVTPKGDGVPVEDGPGQGGGGNTQPPRRLRAPGPRMEENMRAADQGRWRIRATRGTGQRGRAELETAGSRQACT